MSGHPTHFALTNELPKIQDRWDDIHVMQEGGRCVCSVECPCIPTFDYGNNIRQMAFENGVMGAFAFPGFVVKYFWRRRRQVV